MCNQSLWHPRLPSGSDPTPYGGAMRYSYPMSPPREEATSPWLPNKNCLLVSRASRNAPAVRDEDAALDVVQDAMIKLAENYAGRPAAELPPLFQRILSNATMDWFRRQKVRGALFRNFSDFEPAGGDEDFDILEVLEAFAGEASAESASEAVSRGQVFALIESQIADLPARQREAFLLRYWEELDVSETALAMGCSEGSVKTHCSRAVHALAKALNAKGITL